MCTQVCHADMHAVMFAHMFTYSLVLTCEHTGFYAHSCTCPCLRTHTHIHMGTGTRPSKEVKMTDRASVIAATLCQMAPLLSTIEAGLAGALSQGCILSSS